MNIFRRCRKKSIRNKPKEEEEEEDEYKFAVLSKKEKKEEESLSYPLAKVNSSKSIQKLRARLRCGCDQHDVHIKRLFEIKFMR